MLKCHIHPCWNVSINTGTTRVSKTFPEFPAVATFPVNRWKAVWTPPISHKKIYGPRFTQTALITQVVTTLRNHNGEHEGRSEPPGHFLLTSGFVQRNVVTCKRAFNIHLRGPERKITLLDYRRAAHVKVTLRNSTPPPLPRPVPQMRVTFGKSQHNPGYCVCCDGE